MVGLGTQRILLIGDHDRHMLGLLAEAVPGALVTSTGSYFDAIAELTVHHYTTVLAAIEPIERRPESAVRTLRDLTGEGRLLLFGHPTLEPLSRKMLEFGCDDYIVTPASATELQQMFGVPQLSIGNAEKSDNGHDSLATHGGNGATAAPAGRSILLAEIPLAEILVEALAAQPHDACRTAMERINQRIGPAMRLYCVPTGRPDPATPEGMTALSHGIRSDGTASGTLLLMLPRQTDPTPARHALAELAHLFGRLAMLQERHNRLQRLAIIDDLTGVYNGRYFKHFLHRICDKALEKQFGVTLLLFDIDDFKKYNDQYGHGAGDEILRETATLMRRCCREHDLVARISGDEFAVVFWDKDGPRLPRDTAGPDATSPTVATASSSPAAERTLPPARPPQHPWQVFKRFKQLIASSQFSMLGTQGKGTLTISGGLATFPWETRDPDKLIELADKRLMFGAKRCGKDTLILVGEESCLDSKKKP